MTIPVAYHTNCEELATILIAKLSTITIANGFSTDIGLRVYDGRRQITVERMPCIILVEGDDRPTSFDVTDGMVRQALLNQHYVAEGIDFCEDADAPNVMGRAIVRALKTVIFAKDDVLRKKIKYLRYAGRNIGVRDDGTKVVSAYIEFDIGFMDELAPS